MFEFTVFYIVSVIVTLIRWEYDDYAKTSPFMYYNLRDYTFIGKIFRSVIASIFNIMTIFAFVTGLVMVIIGWYIRLYYVVIKSIFIKNPGWKDIPVMKYNKK